MSVALTQLEVPDYDLGLRGKLVRTEKLDGDGLAFCTIVHGLSLTDEVTDTPTSNAANGYPDARVRVDPDTVVELPWRTGRVTAAIGDLVDADDVPIPASARGLVGRLAGRYAELGLEPVLGFEYELWIEDAETRAPLGRTENAYSLTRLRETEEVAAAFIDRMEQIGAPVEAFHAELGPGFFEFALKPQPALRAADGAARARQYFRDLCAERGLRATFMAKPYGDRSGAGGHVHSSLVRAGRNVFADRPGELSPLAETYLAGLLATMGDLSALVLPFVNSYKRLDKEMFVAESATWGPDDRSTALRVLLDSVPGARVEHRRPGADASPYLVAAALLGGGLVGIDEGLTLPPSGPRADAEPLPADLRAAADRLEASHHAKAVLGEDFVTGYVATRRDEAARYERWLQTTITDWELRRYGEHL
ncbi:glutamine synthetase family protein [Nocardioides carbamazepini]|uniref:glutamine synthetase family protein n=1 Tax=Nocardioides carbamazepini TaxID=2854259 RepID=UPI002149E36E|nr:glutamine synthetase family protein [Nocardioides carbamazepini]MCR1785560.1 glutamine synthetase family protein [Nocardioides carbamazepini]